MPLRAIVFDFDGLIADTEWPEYRAVAEQFERHGLEYPPAGWAHVLSTAWSVDWPADLEARLRRPVDRSQLEADRRRRSSELRRGLAPLPGVVELVAAAHRAEVPLAVASSSPRSWVQPHLEAFGLADRFVAVRTRDDVALAKRPRTCSWRPAPPSGSTRRRRSPSRIRPTA